MKIERVHDARRLNEILNNPHVYRWVVGWNVGPLDGTIPAKDLRNVLLVGDGGAIMFVYIHQAFYEAHTQILRTHRGPWAVEFTQQCLHYLFTRTAAMEVLTRCPTLASKALATRVGGTKLFTNKTGWIIDNDPVPADIYSLTLQNWIPNAPGLEARGKWFHDQLEAKLKELNLPLEGLHAPDPTHDRYVGFAVDCAFAGQLVKATVLYNRYASLADYEPIRVVSTNPPVIDIGTASLELGDQDFKVLTCPSEQSQVEPSSVE